MKKDQQYRLGVDVGGTHTDLVLLNTATGEVAVEKVADAWLKKAIDARSNDKLKRQRAII